MQPETSPRHVLMVIESDYPSIDGGGAEAQIETLTSNLPEDIRATVVAPLVPCGPDAIEDIVHDVPVHRLWYPRLPLIGGFIMLLRLAFFILTRRRVIDAIHCHIANNMTAVCAAVGTLLGIPVLVKLTGMTELEGGILSSRRSISLSFKRWLIMQASGFQAISKELEASLIEKGFDPARIHLVPNAVNTTLFAPNSDQRDSLKQHLGIEATFVACFVGRLVPEKALDMLIRAWDQAIPRDADAALVLVGTGHLENDLRTLAKNLGRADQVVFAGFVQDKAKIADYWRIADLGLLTSDFEGLSNALLEAMASAVPMIGSRVSGNSDLITPGETGWLFEPRQQGQLTDCLRQAFEMAPSKRLAMGGAARQRALGTVGVDHIWDRLSKLYAGEKQEAMALCAE